MNGNYNPFWLLGVLEVLFCLTAVSLVLIGIAWLVKEVLL